MHGVVTKLLAAKGGESRLQQIRGPLSEYNQTGDNDHEQIDPKYKSEIEVDGFTRAQPRESTTPPATTAARKTRPEAAIKATQTAFISLLTPTE